MGRAIGLVILWALAAVGSLNLDQQISKKESGSKLKAETDVSQPGDKGYEQAIVALHQELGNNYPCFKLKGIDWKKVGDEFFARGKDLKTDEEFGLLCLELVARLEDSHAYLTNGTAKVPTVVFPQWDPGFACLIDDRDRTVAYYVDKGGPADTAGLKVGMTILAINGRPAAKCMEEMMARISKYSGYSSERYLRYHAAQWLGSQMERGAIVELQVQDADEQIHVFKAPATLGTRYLPRRPVQIKGTYDSANVSWARLSEKIGYIYVRRVSDDLPERLERAVGALKGMEGLIIDVRGNSGGSYDPQRSHSSFDPETGREPNCPVFTGPIALLIDARCISAGEGWASWFVAKKRARFFGEATAGASSRKTVYTLTNGLFKVHYPVKAYCGYIDRTIERRGIEPDVPVRQNARDLMNGRDTVVEAARRYIMEQTSRS